MRHEGKLLAFAISAWAATAHATNGMNLEGYGPLGMSMGGASMAYDSGLAAMMNNPATLALSGQGSQMALALHHLGPDVKVQGVADSGGNSYFMPAAGWGRKTGALTYGVGMFAQGGMGTEYGRSSPFSMGTGQEVRSELGVGRLIFPVAYEVTPDLAVGASLDFVWAMLDLGMVATRNDVLGMTSNTVDINTAPYGNASFAHIGFSDSNDFTGKAKGTGWAGKLGLTYKVNPNLTFGAAYHSKTALGDMETSGTGASMTLFNNVGTQIGVPLVGKMTVINFQWPETYAAGLAWQATSKVMLAADIRRLKWSDAMQNFRMSFSGMSMTMPQQWRDQDVYSVGLQYRPNDRLGLRVGYNYGKNPVPDDYLHPLFPATVETHYTAGFDYRLSDRGCIAFAVSYAPKVTDTNTLSAPGTTVSHSQLSLMLGYNHQF
ncbi:MAG: outer membrane protein transport protein [Pseudomonadota bacterium]